MTRKLKKVLALLLTLSMVMSMVTVTSLAAEGEGRYCVGCTKYQVYRVAQVDPTCETEGVVEHYSCKNCGRNYYESSLGTLVWYSGQVDRIDKLGHNYSIAATCQKAPTCERCGAEDPNGQKDPSNHTNVVTDPAVEPACTETGLTEGSHCADCKVVIVAQVGVPSKGHTVVDVEAVPATCLKAGTTAGTKCSTCGVILSGVEVDPQKDHSYVGEYVDLGEDGHAQKCVNGCDGHGETVEHSGNWVVTKNATCTAKGEETQTCVCGHVTTRESNMLDHKDENKDNVCDDCGATICDHAWEGVQTKAPNYKEEGEMEYTCSKCGATKTESIAKLVCNHDHEGDRQYEDLGNELHKITCKTCDEVLVASEAHDFDENGACTVCGAQAVARIIKASRAAVSTNEFTTLQAAINAAGDGDTVEVMKDCVGAALTEAKSITLNVPENVTVNGGNYGILVQNEAAELTITGKGTIQGTNYGAVAQKNGMLNVNGCTIQGGKFGMYLASGASATVEESAIITRTKDDSSGFAIGVYGPGGDTSDNPTTLTVKGGTISNTKNAAIAGNGTVSGKGDSRNTQITINGGTITSTESWGIYHPQQGEMTITGGTITGITGIEMRAGTLNVSGDAVITGTNEEYSHDLNSNGATTKGVGIAVSQHVTERPITAVISGGTITGYHAVVEHDLQNDPQSEHVTLKIEGGKFTATGEDNVTVISDNFEKFITGGYFSNDVTDTDNAKYLADTYASHPVSTYEGYFHVHQPVTQEGWSHDDDGHWTNCVGHEDCLVTVNEKAAHAWDGGVVTTEPTYDAEGVRTFTCDTCGHTRTESIPALERPTDPDPDPTTYYTLTIRYVDAEGNQVAPTVTRRLEEGSRYTVDSPAVEGMTPDQETVTGILNGRTEITVTYAADENVDDNQPPMTETPETSEPTESTEPDETGAPEEIEETEELGDTDTPLTETPEETEDLDDNDTPLTEAPEETEELGETDTPRADVPQTGDMLWLWILLAVGSASGLVWVSLEEKKGKRAVK